jgi:hypothetical protein
MNETHILIRLLQMYIPWNCEIWLSFGKTSEFRYTTDHKLHLHHFVIAECRQLKQKGVAVYCLVTTLLLYLSALCWPPTPTGVTCILNIIPSLSSGSQFSSVNGREAFGVGGWVSRLKSTSPM